MMKIKIKKILVPLDCSKNSMKGLIKAIYLARQCGSTITGLCVISPLYPPIRLPGIMNAYDRYMTKTVKKFMREAKKLSAQNGIVFNEKIIQGAPSSDIVKFANGKKFDLIIIGSRGMSSLKTTFLGSVSNRVLHESKIPVLIVK